MKKNVWDWMGKGLATVAKAAGQAALWASEHPEVLQILAALATKK